jgi:restriction system protein
LVDEIPIHGKLGSGMSFWNRLIATAKAPVDKMSLEEKLQAIDWYQFEKLITTLFETEGHRVHRRGGAHPDGGIDLVVQTETGDETLIQCKHWKAWNVGVRHIRELMGSMMDSGIQAAILITLRGYTADAKELALKHNVVLLDGRDVLQMIQEVKPSLQTQVLAFLEPDKKRCPKCENTMTLRTATKGANAGNQFWGCSSFPKCRYVLSV